MKTRGMVDAPSSIDIEKYRLLFRKLCNRAKYKDAYRLAKQLSKRYPDVFLFQYEVALLTGEEETGYTKAQIKKRHKLAAKKFRPLLLKLKTLSPTMRRKVRNEYYWFSHQPYKQFRLGVGEVKHGRNEGYYSQGVGAIEVAKQYALKGQHTRCHRWAKRSEQAWLKFFKAVPNWFNSYLFYARALGYQGQTKEMERALQRAAKIAGKSIRWKTLNEVRAEVKKTLFQLYKTPS